ncbi:MAG: hypothetical protein LC660_18045 [Desulfobacteraceae bacterium]|nr:hypothetical protein [Desulfobacteraceae bacterium]
MEDDGMPFHTESTGYEKTILSDLQGAWINFRASVADNAGFSGWKKVLFHTDEAMSWETVRNLKLMPPLVLMIRNLCVQGKAPEDVLNWLNEIHELLQEALDTFSR